MRAGAWSVPVVAAAVAAPAFAVSPGVCATCATGRPPVCIVDVVVGQPPGTGDCRCGTGLVCAAVGPLNLAQVCVSEGLLLVSCGATTCRGVCLTAGGTAVTAVNNLVTGVTGLLQTAGCAANQQGTVPSNVCATPVAQDGVGTLGAICLVNSGGGLLGSALVTLVNTFKATLNGLGLGPASSCQSPYTCAGGVSLTASGALCTVPGYNLRVGFCQC